MDLDLPKAEDLLIDLINAEVISPVGLSRP